MLGCKRLGFRQLSHLKPLRLAQLHCLLHFENSLPAAITNVNMYGPVLVAVEKEPIAVPFENLRHTRRVPTPQGLGEYFCRTLVLSGAGPRASERKQNGATGIHSCTLVGPACTLASLHQAPAGRHVYSHAPPCDALKPRRGGMGRAGQFNAAPMGLKTVLLGCLYYKHVAPTELAAQLPAVTASLAPQSCDAISAF